MKTLDLDSLELKKGQHDEEEKQFCVMEAVAFVAGEPWSDSPQCASPVIAAFLRSYNDSVSDEVRQSLKKYIPLLIDTRGSAALEERRSLIAADWLVRTYTPAWLRLAGLTSQAEALETLPEIIAMAQIPSIIGTIEAARESAAKARAAALAAAGAAAWVEAWVEAGAGALAAAGAAAWVEAWVEAGAGAAVAAGGAAWVAAWVEAWVVAGAAAGAAAWVAAWVAGAKLAPTVAILQATIPTLIDRMIAAKEDA
jgi:hypothetical protein